MPTDFKYSLTRICLRTGQLTLPLAMLELFPNEGEVLAFDTNSGREFDLLMKGPRTVAGLQDFFELHQLEVNDQLLIRLLEDGRYALTAVTRPKKVDYSRPEATAKILDDLAELASPFSEAEIRGLYPDLPADFDLAAAVGQDGRFVKYEGRWQLANAVAPANEALDELELIDPAETSLDKQAKEPKEVPNKKRQAMVTPYPRGVMFPGDAGLNSEQEPNDLSLHGKAREVLQDFGFRIEGLSHGQLMAHADLGRRHYSVLVHIHPQGAHLDWAAVLARRRETGATYLAVFGEHRDLLKQHSPAGLAQATLWSWEAIARAQDLVQTVPVSPFDLEPHFQRDGLFEYGLERFEKSVGKRIAERGNFSAVLARLASMKSPAVFMLEDVVVDADIPRDQVLKVIDLLAQAPFHLVTRVDSGEFCLRHSVSQGLLQLSEYALSLRDRLPSRRTERLQGTPALDDTHSFDSVESVSLEAENGG